MHVSWRIDADRVKSDPDPVNFAGDFGKRFTIEVKKKYNGDLTRHHIINIQVLQDFWNAAMTNADRATFEAMGLWCGLPPVQLASLLEDPANRDPGDFQKQFCWNPFNIVIGPSTGHRIGDPGEEFDFLQFRSFPKFTSKATPEFSESLARQEFNSHMERLKRINEYMGRYIKGVGTDAGLFPQEVDNLRALLKSDRPSKYPNIFKALRAKAELKKPEYDEAADTAQVKRLAGRFRSDKTTPVYISQYSPDRLPGAITHPDLWAALSMSAVPDFGFEMPGHVGVYESRVDSQKVVPWVSTSYLPEPDYVAPAGAGSLADRHPGLFETGTVGVPMRDPVARIPVERGVVDDAFAGKFVNAVQALGEIPKRSGLRVFVLGPGEPGGGNTPIFREALERIVAETVKLNAAGNRLRIASLSHRPELRSVEVRLYFY